MKQQTSKTRGSILILALWTLVLLTTFSFSLAAGVRQRMLMVQRFESRHKLSLAAASGIRKAMAMLFFAYEQAGEPLAVAAFKAFLTNNKTDFSSMNFGTVTTDIIRTTFTKTFRENKTHYGMIDEASKININFADQSSLTRLFSSVLGLDTEKAEKLALAIIDWRTSGETALKGFFSQEYYKNLKYPYEPKNSDFEILNEVLLVEGVQKDFFDRLQYFITIYGDGKINVNTASFAVLYAIGFNADVAGRILEARAGRDGIEGTLDDVVFSSTEDFVAVMRSSSALTENDVLFAQALQENEKIVVSSNFYSLEAVASTLSRKQQMSIRCVYDAAAHKIVYWQET